MKVMMGEHHLSYALYSCNCSFTSSDRSRTDLFRHMQHTSSCILWFSQDVGILYQLIVHMHAGMNRPWSLRQVISESSKRRERVGRTSNHISIFSSANFPIPSKHPLTISLNPPISLPNHSRFGFSETNHELHRGLPHILPSLRRSPSHHRLPQYPHRIV